LNPDSSSLSPGIFVQVVHQYSGDYLAEVEEVGTERIKVRPVKAHRMVNTRSRWVLPENTKIADTSLFSA
jgi:hypothetical protein